MKKKLKYEKKTIDNEHISKIVNKAKFHFQIGVKIILALNL